MTISFDFCLHLTFFSMVRLVLKLGILFKVLYIYII